MSGERDLNPPPSVWETDALPDELSPLKKFFKIQLLSFKRTVNNLQ